MFKYVHEVHCRHCSQLAAYSSPRMALPAPGITLTCDVCLYNGCQPGADEAPYPPAVVREEFRRMVDKECADCRGTFAYPVHKDSPYAFPESTWCRQCFMQRLGMDTMTAASAALCWQTEITRRALTASNGTQVNTGGVPAVALYPDSLTDQIGIGVFETAFCYGTWDGTGTFTAERRLVWSPFLSLMTELRNPWSTAPGAKIRQLTLDRHSGEVLTDSHPKLAHLQAEDLAARLTQGLVKDDVAVDTNKQDGASALETAARALLEDLRANRPLAPGFDLLEAALKGG